jgi:hypothetical protein
MTGSAAQIPSPESAMGALFFLLAARARYRRTLPCCRNICCDCGKRLYKTAKSTR